MADELMIKNVDKVYTMSSAGILRNVDILVRNGKIVNLGKNLDAGREAKIIDGSGLTALPGLIDACTHIGIYVLEWESGDHGVEKSDPITPHLKVLDAMDPYDPAFEDAVKGGVTTVAIHPGSYLWFGEVVDAITIMPGQVAVVKTNRRILVGEHGIVLAVGEHVKRFFEKNKLAPTTRMGMLATIRAHLVKAKDYEEKRTKGEIPIDLKLEALMKLLRGELIAYIHAYTARDIINLVNLLHSFNIDRIIVIHGVEAFKIARVLRERHIPVILGPIIFSKRGVELRELDSKLPVKLHKEGILFSLTTDHPTIPVQYLTILASTAVGEGLPYIEALKSITLNPARILGIDDRVGSLEPGKDADIVLFEGDPLDPTSKVAYTIIDGEVSYSR